MLGKLGEYDLMYLITCAIAETIRESNLHVSYFHNFTPYRDQIKLWYRG